MVGEFKQIQEIQDLFLKLFELPQILVEYDKDLELMMEEWSATGITFTIICTILR